MNREEYKKMVGLIYVPLFRKLKLEKEYNDFLKKIIEVSECSLRSLIFKDFREVNFEKDLTKSNIYFWLKKVSLVLISHSYYSIVSVKKWHDTEELLLKGIPDEVFFETALKYYNSIFESDADWEDVFYYASGYKEIIESGEEEKSLLEKDYRAVGSELLAGIWGEDIDSDDYSQKRGMFLGFWIKKTHKKLIVPFLQEITLNPKKKK